MASLTHAVEVVWARGAADVDAWALLRTVVAARLGVAVEGVHLAAACGRCGSAAHGRPAVVSSAAAGAPQVSLSRAGDLTVVAVADAGPVGVDVERVDAACFGGFDAVALHPDERAATGRDRATTWVRKESLLKATGHGLTVDPRDLLLGPPGRPPRLVGWAAGPPPHQVQMYDVEVDRAHVVAVTVLCEERPALTVREAAREGPPRAATPRRAPPVAGGSAPRRAR